MLYNNNRSRVVYDEMAFGVEKKETEQSCDDTDESIFVRNKYSASAFQASVRQGGSGRANDTDDDIFHLKSYHNSTSPDLHSREWNKSCFA